MKAGITEFRRKLASMKIVVQPGPWSLRSLVKDEIHPAFVRADDFARAGSSWG
jgi:hypothetical protein